MNRYLVELDDYKLTEVEAESEEEVMSMISEECILVRELESFEKIGGEVYWNCNFDHNLSGVYTIVSRDWDSVIVSNDKHERLVAFPNELSEVGTIRAIFEVEVLVKSNGKSLKEIQEELRERIQKALDSENVIESSIVS